MNKILTNEEDEALPYEEHPELHHYTDAAGVRGIISSNQIWATHYSHLNDITEVFHLKDALKKVLSKKILGFIDDLKKTRGRRYRRTLKRQGSEESIALEEASKVLDALHKATFEGVTKPVPFANPYIVSFCSHAKDQVYEQENGLLSQWNRYGGNSGFALVFDTQKLSDCLEDEIGRYEYRPLSFMDVIYAVDPDAIESEFTGLLDLLMQLLRQHVLTGHGDAAPLYYPFVKAATRLKHQGFKEEREVRIVACPTTKEFLELLKAEHPDMEEPKSLLKTISTRNQGKVSFISLFDNSVGMTLPIKRVIVGPGKEQATAKIELERFLDGRISVVCSETPYVQRAWQ